MALLLDGQAITPRAVLIGQCLLPASGTTVGFQLRRNHQARGCLLSQGVDLCLETSRMQGCSEPQRVLQRRVSDLQAGRPVEPRGTVDVPAVDVQHHALVAEFLGHGEGPRQQG